MKTLHGFRKGDRLTVDIESIGPGGEGVAKPGGITVFVSRVAPGDRVEIELFDVRKNFAFGKALSIVEPSSLRSEPPCKLFKVCGGCHWQHINYAAQLELKTDLVRQALKHIGGVNADIVLPAVLAEEPLFYRNKVQYPVASPVNSRRILAGYFKEGSHELINIKHCPVQPEPLDRLLDAAKEALEHSGISAYRERDHGGELRHIAARYSFAFNEILLTLVINEKFPGMPATIKKLRSAGESIVAKVPEVIGVCANFNPERGNRIMGSHCVTLVGREYITEKLGSKDPQAALLHREGITFRLGPLSFFQVNSAQSVQLLEIVAAALRLHCSERPGLIVDAYGGVGTIALWLSPYADRLICMEEVEAAVDDGKAIASLNGITNVEYQLGKVEDLLPPLAGATKLDAVVVDPPRKGLASSVIETIAASLVPLVIYVSCNPSTLARDLKLFAERGYDAVSVQPLDMFPQTHHVESVCVLRRI